MPAGFTGSDPILVELNVDSAVTCVWDALGLVECVENDGDVDGLSWTIVEVENTPVQATPTPTPTDPDRWRGGCDRHAEHHAAADRHGPRRVHHPER